MKRLVSYLPFVVVLSLIILALPAFAQNETALDVHLNNPVAIPGKVLAAGNYVFRLSDLGGGPSDVEVFTPGGSPVSGFIPVYESIRDHNGNSMITITKPDQAGVVRITSWYFPGEQFGYRFVYSKSDMRKLDTIARRMHSQTTAGM